MKEYRGELPKHVVAQLQEHTAGGYILFRIGPDGDIITDTSFDSETSYLALVKKAGSTIRGLEKLDDIEAIRALAGDLGLTDEEEEEGESLEGDETED